MLVPLGSHQKKELNHSSNELGGSSLSLPTNSFHDLTVLSQIFEPIRAAWWRNINHSQGCHASGRPRPRPADVRTRPTIPRTSALADVRLGCRPLADGEAVWRRRTATPSAGGRPQLPSTGSRPPPPSIWGHPLAPSALYDSNFSFLHYVFVSLIAVTWSNSILKKLVENSL
jgi:hypothetical protein